LLTLHGFKSEVHAIAKGFRGRTGRLCQWRGGLDEEPRKSDISLETTSTPRGHTRLKELVQHELEAGGERHESGTRILRLAVRGEDLIPASKSPTRSVGRAAGRVGFLSSGWKTR